MTWTDGIFSTMTPPISDAMLVAIDRSGRLVMPKELRRRLHLEGGGTVSLREIEGGVEIRPVVTPVDLVWTDGLPVAVGQTEEALTDDVVRATLESGRR